MRLLRGVRQLTNTGTGSTYVYDDMPGGVLMFEASTGKLTFTSDTYRNHDGTPSDDAGNMITLNINATDGVGAGANTSTTQAAVNVMINVAPTDIWFADSATGLSGVADCAVAVGSATTFVVTVNEHIGTEAALPMTGDLGARLNVQDANADLHKFGTHEVMISGEDRFMITHAGYTGRRDSEDTDNLGSTWEVRLKPGEKLDFETQADMDPITAGKQIVLTLTATDESGGWL